jgi:hypothetical protein
LTPIRNFLYRIYFKLRQKIWAAQVRAAKRVMEGGQAWQAMDRMGIPGLGTELLRLDFLPDSSNVPAWDSSSQVFYRLAKILDADSSAQTEMFERCLVHATKANSWPRTKMKDSPLPWIENEFLSKLDMVGLYGMVRETRPERYVEIGCGISTRVALAAIVDGGLQTRMFCVDPAPRVDLPAAAIEHLPKKLESALGTVIDLATPGSIVFFDGSHRSLPGSDVTLFFIELLPALRPGVIVHIHDIFLPDDYPADRSRRYWSEEYLLATWLPGGTLEYEILLPGARLEQRADSSTLIPKDLRSGSDSGTRFSSFWMRKK